jgi:hypothetical protein
LGLLYFVWSTTFQNNQRIEGSETPVNTTSEDSEPEERPLTLTPKVYDYFEDIALKSEVGSRVPATVKWVDPICPQITFPEETELSVNQEVQEKVETILKTVESFGVPITWDNCEPNWFFNYVSADNFAEYNLNSSRGQVGFVWIHWNKETIINADVLVSSEYLTEEQTDHVILEEVTQSLGLLNDTNEYPDSIFYQGWTQTTKWSELDVALIRLLYSDHIEHDMSLEEFREFQQVGPG